MRFSTALGWAVLVAAGSSAAHAQEAPRYIPDRDVVVTYAVKSDQPNIPPEVTVHYSASGRVRIDAGEHGTVFYETASNRARWLIPQAKMLIDLPVRGTLMEQIVPASGAHFVRGGTRTVAGLTCTDWRVTTPKGAGSGCVTADGVVLRGEGADQKGHSGAIEATSVSYAEQPLAVFEPPPGTQSLSFAKGFKLPIPAPK